MRRPLPHGFFTAFRMTELMPRDLKTYPSQRWVRRGVETTLRHCKSNHNVWRDEHVSRNSASFFRNRPDKAQPGLAQYNLMYPLRRRRSNQRSSLERPIWLIRIRSI